MTATNPKPVLTKTDFVKRYAAGEFGNASPTWDHLDDVFAAAEDDALFTEGKRFHIRNRVASGRTRYDVCFQDLWDAWEAMIDAGELESNLYISEMAPTEKTLFQGEVQRTENGLELYYTTVPKPMRDALKISSEQTDGLRAKTLIEFYLNTKDYEWLMYLLDSYPDHVVEFSTYAVEWGTVPGHRTVFWEVRKY